MTKLLTGSDILLQTLIDQGGVDTIFWYPWGASIPLYNSLANADIRHILAKHEQGAAFMAQWYARSTGRLWVVDATSGPWVANTFTAIADAYKDSIWMLLISGQVPTNMIGRDAFQELDTRPVFGGVTKYFRQIGDVWEIVPETMRAIEVALSGRPGPVHIDIPKDIQLAIASSDIWDFWNTYQKPTIPCQDIESLTRLIEGASRPIFLIGQWVKFSWAERELLGFLEKSGIPMVETALAKWVISPDNEYNLWMLGMHGFYEANMAVSEADLIINIGSRFDDRIVGTYESFWKGAQIVHVDIDDWELEKLVKTDLPIHADAKDFLEKLLQSDCWNPEQYTAWRRQIQSWKAEKPYEIDSHTFGGKQVLQEVSRIAKELPQEVVFWVDVGQHQMWASQILEIEGAENWLFSGWFGTMGFSLPACIWAAVANPDKKVISISGDGGIQMNIQELWLLLQNDRNALRNLDIKIIILDNEYLWMVKQWQDLFQENQRSQVDVLSPDFWILANAYWIKNHKLESLADLEGLEEILSQDGPALIWCKIEKEENVFPMVPAGKRLDQMVFE